MKKALGLVAIFLTAGLVIINNPPSVYAGTIACPTVSFNPNPPTTAGYTASFAIPQQLIQPNNTYEIRRRNAESAGGWDTSIFVGGNYTSLSGNTLSRTFDGNFAAGDRFEFMVVINGEDYCNYTSPPIYGSEGPPSCSPNLITIPENTVVGQQVTIGLNSSSGLVGFSPGSYTVNLNGTNLCTAVVGVGGITNCNTKTLTFFQSENTLSVADYLNSSHAFCALSITIPTEPGGEVIIGETDPDEVPLQTLPYELCKQINDPVAKGSCESCYGQTPRGIWTAVGCIPATSSGMIRQVLTIGLSLAGGAAILLILASGFLFSTSQGDPKRTGEAKELLTSAVIGLLFIIFGVTILQFIGVTLFRLPGFGM